jgi:transposase
MSDEELQWFVGVDWGKEKHQVCVVDEKGRVLGERGFAHSAAGLASQAEWIRSFTDSSAIGVAIETPNGPVVEGLLERGFAIFAVNPKQLDRFRDRFTVAGAKDDRRDAHVLADSLRTDRVAYRRVRVENPLVIQLRECSRMLDELQQERVRLVNRLHAQLWRYYGQLVEMTDDVAADWFLELLLVAPTPADARKLSRKRVEELLRRHRIRRIAAATLVRALRGEPIMLVEGTVEAASRHVATLVPRLQLLNAQHRAAQRQLDALVEALAAEGRKKEQRDEEILRSLPGVGRIVLATLLAEAGEALRARDYHALRKLCGVAPVTRQSGKSRNVIMRYACSPRLRAALFHWARCAIQHDPKSRSKYTALRARGHKNGRALRGVGDRLLNVACVMLATGTVFDPDKAGCKAA